MTKDVALTIQGFHMLDGVWQEPVITSARGKYIFRSGHHFVSYEEHLPEGVVKGLLKWNENGLAVSKKGAVTSSLELTEGKRISTSYATAAGTLEFETLTRSVFLQEGEDRLELEARYALYARGGDEPLQESRIVIQVEEGCKSDE